MTEKPLRVMLTTNRVLTRKKDKVLLLRDPPKEFDLLTDFSPVFEEYELF